MKKSLSDLKLENTPFSFFRNVTKHASKVIKTDPSSSKVSAEDTEKAYKVKATLRELQQDAENLYDPNWFQKFFYSDPNTIKGAIRRLLPSMVYAVPLALTAFLLGCTLPVVLTVLGALSALILLNSMGNTSGHIQALQFQLPLVMAGIVGKLVFMGLVAVAFPVWACWTVAGAAGVLVMIKIANHINFTFTDGIHPQAFTKLIEMLEKSEEYAEARREEGRQRPKDKGWEPSSGDNPVGDPA